nr:cytochrome ubiquinol oxidase subunit I [uncultured Ralstonia sp.]
MQFALTVGFHYIFVPLTLGLVVCVAAMDTAHMTTGCRGWRRSARFWNRFFLLAWLVGMATGYPLRQQLEQQWSGYNAYAHEVLRAVMGMEGLILPVMVVLVIGLTFAAHRMMPGTRVLARWLLVLAILTQAASILTMNAWMQHPVGTELGEGSVRVISLQKIFLSSTALCKVAHTLSAGLLTGALFIAAISAFYLMRQRDLDVARRSMMLALPTAAVSLALVVSSGHASGHDVMLHQPMKFAAIEAHWVQGEGPSALTLLAVPDMGAQVNHHAVEVPRLLSWLATDGDTSPLGIRELVSQAELRIEAALREKGLAHSGGWRQLYEQSAQAHEDWDSLSAQQRLHVAALASRPNVPVLFTSFRVMVGCALLLMVLLGWAIARRRVLFAGGDRRTWLLLCLSLPLPWVATFAGWTVAEVGRQPWVIHEQMTTAVAAVLPIQSHGIVPLLGWATAYILLGILSATTVIWLVKRGAQPTAWAMRSRRGRSNLWSQLDSRPQ